MFVLAAAVLPLLLGQQVASTTGQDLGAKGDLFNVTGLRESELGESGPFRWSDEKVTIDLQPLGWPLYTTLYVQGVRPEGEPLARVGAEAYGKALGVREIPRSPTTLEYRLPVASLLSINPRIELTSTLFQPPGDSRTLGIVYYRVEHRSGPGPSLPAPWPALPLALSVVLAYAAVRGIMRIFGWGVGVSGSRLWTGPLIFAVSWGVAIGALNALARPWLAFYSWYMIVPPLVALLIAPWLAALRSPASTVGEETTTFVAEPAFAEKAWPIAISVTISSLALFLWHFLAPTEPPRDDPTHNVGWGVSFYTALPWPLQIAGLTIVLGSLLWAWFAPLPTRMADDAAAQSHKSSKERAKGFWDNVQSAFRIPHSAIPLVGMALFALLPVAYSEGDSDEFDTKIPKGAIWRERELLDFYLKVRLWRLLEGIMRLPSHVYALVAVIAGGIYLAGAGLLGRTLGKSRSDALVILGALAATGNILIFFRYVESYALVTALSIFVLWACWRYTEGMLSFGAVGALATLAPLVHGSALWWGPMVVAAWLLRARQIPPDKRWRIALSDLRDGVFVGLAIVVVVVSIMLIDAYDWERLQAGLEEMGGGDARTLLPLFTIETRFEHYPFFSWSHLGAVIQEQLLTAPLALVTLGIVAVLASGGVRQVARRTPAFVTLAVGAAGMFFYSISWNPDLGPRNDWDLLALPALPLTLLAIYLLLQLPTGKARRLALTAYLSVSAVHTAGWVLLHLLGIRY